MPQAIRPMITDEHVRADARDATVDRHPTALGRRLDDYLAAVVHELRVEGVITGLPQRTDPAKRLLGSIVVDCTALRRGAALHPEGPAPVVVTWDEDTGWCVGMHHDPAHASRRFLRPDVLPAPTTVAHFVVGLALGYRLGAAEPIGSPEPGRARLRAVP